MYKIRSVESRTSKSGKPYKLLHVVDPTAYLQASIFDFEDGHWSEGEEINVHPFIDYHGHFSVKPVHIKR